MLIQQAKRRAEEAESGRTENRRLYEELQEAFDRASEAEALRRSERIKSALLDAVTHDLRTPLTSIKASATLLLEDGEGGQTEAFSPAEQKTMLRLISDDADRLDRFVESMVDLARIEAGDIRLSRNWSSVEEMIEAALARTEPLMREHQLRILVEKELPVIRVDARAVAEVIYTLIDNATKYAPAGYVHYDQGEPGLRRDGQSISRRPGAWDSATLASACLRQVLSHWSQSGRFRSP